MMWKALCSTFTHHTPHATGHVIGSLQILEGQIPGLNLLVECFGQVDGNHKADVAIGYGKAS